MSAGSMNRLERYEDIQTALRAALEGMQTRLWTGLPGIIVSYDAVEQTVSVQPAIQGRVQYPGEEPIYKDLPVLIHCPVFFPQGGGFTLTFPIAAGDECYVAFSSRCIDAWWQQGGTQPEAEMRLHSLSDGFAFVGVRSQLRRLENVSTNTVQLRSDDGETFIELTGGQIANIKAPGGINLESDGDISLKGTSIILEGSVAKLEIGPKSAFTGLVDANGFPIDQTHTHTAVTSGTDVSGPVSP